LAFKDAISYAINYGVTMFAGYLGSAACKASPCDKYLDEIESI
jgi:hypothetical protein